MSREGDFWGIVRSAEVTSTFDWEAEDWEALAVAFSDLPYDPSLRRHAAKRVWRLPGVKVAGTVFVFPKIQQEDPIFVWMVHDVYVTAPLSFWNILTQSLLVSPDQVSTKNPQVDLFVRHPKNVLNLPDHLPLGRLLRELSWSEADLIKHLVLAPVFTPVEGCPPGWEIGGSGLLRVFSPWAGIPLGDVLYQPAMGGSSLVSEPVATCFLRMWERT